MSAPRLPSILAVYAHPDDEIFHGAGALTYWSDRGARVTLACATRGERGKPHPSVGRVDDLGALRSEELRQSCEIFGFEPPVFLGFHDSARKERQAHDDPRALANVDMLEVEGAIRRVVDEVKPHVMITFDPHGGYFHPDHLAVHRAATAAFYSSGVLGDDAPMRLFYSTFSQKMFRDHADATRGWGVVDGLDPDMFAVADATVAVRFDAHAYLDRKLTAFAAHRSAFGVTRDMLPKPPEDAARVLHGFRPLIEQEVFSLGATRGPISRWPLESFFDGIETG